MQWPGVEPTGEGDGVGVEVTTLSSRSEWPPRGASKLMSAAAKVEGTVVVGADAARGTRHPDGTISNLTVK